MDSSHYKYIIWLLARRSYHSVQLREKLKKRGASPPEIEKILTQLKEQKFINDDQYIQSYIRDQLARKPQGIRKLRARLLQKGIKGPAVDRHLNAAAPQEPDLAAAALEKKLKTLEKVPPQQKKEKLYRFLASRGFNADTINRALYKTKNLH